MGGNLVDRIEHLAHMYEHVVLHVRPGFDPGALTARTVLAVGSRGRIQDSSKQQAGATVIRAWSGLSGLGRPDRSGVLHVAKLADSDMHELSHGVLGTRSPAGKMLAFAARDLAELKVGLALGAGSIWGYAHSGVLKVLDRLGLPVDYIAGTSVGSAAGA